MSLSLTSILGSEPTREPYPFPSIPDVPEIADRNCKLLGPFAISVQLIMGFVVLGTLVLKRQKEKPKRPWKIWTLDISKQMLGQLFVHSLNVMLSSLGSLASEGANNPCSLYFLNIAIDTTIGVLFIYFSMRFLTHYFTDVLGWPGFVSGQYTSIPTIIGRRRRRRTNDISYDDSILSPPINEATTNDSNASHAQNALNSIQEAIAISESDPSAVAVVPIASPTSNFINNSSNKKQRPRLKFFFRQLLLYLFSLLLMKIMVLLLFLLFPFLYAIGRWVLNLFGPHQKAQIFFVMAVFPLAMNTLQFWLIDSLLRHNPITSIYRNEQEAEAAAMNASNGGGPEAGQPRDSTNDQSDQGQSRRQSWWLRDPSSHHRDGSLSRLMSDHDHDDSSRDDEHAYPPTTSATSSVAQLDTQVKAPIAGPILEQTAVIASQMESNNDKTVVALPASDDSKDTIQGRSAISNNAAVQAVDDEEEDAWDNWNEDNEQTRAKT